MKSLLTHRVYSLILVDAMNLCYIHFHGQRNLSYHGRPTGMLYGIARLVTKLQKDYPHARILFLWEGTHSRRKARYDQYKKHRLAVPTTFKMQVEEVKNFLTIRGIDQSYHLGLEADDMAGYICADATENILLVTSDADWFQFLKPEQIDIKRNTVESFADLQATLGFPPNKMGMWKILTGDKSDGITGVYRMPRPVARLLVNKCATYKEFKTYPLHLHNPVWERWEKTLQSVWDTVIERNAELILFHPEWIENSQIIHIPGNENKAALRTLYKQKGFKSLLYSV